VERGKGKERRKGEIPGKPLQAPKSSGGVWGGLLGKVNSPRGGITKDHFPMKEEGLGKKTERERKKKKGPFTRP